MFKKKVWKRGDKLNAKELNRIEDGIAEGGSGSSNTIIECNMNTENSLASDFSITATELRNLMENNTRITLKTNLLSLNKETNILEQAGVLWNDANQLDDDGYMFPINADGRTYAFYLNIAKDTNEIKLVTED